MRYTECSEENNLFKKLMVKIEISHPKLGKQAEQNKNRFTCLKDFAKYIFQSNKVPTRKAYF